MYSLERTDYGLHVRVWGRHSVDDARRYLDEVRSLPDQRGRSGLGLLLDLRDARRFSAEVEAVIQEASRVRIAKGLTRTAVVYKTAAAAIQVQRILLAGGGLQVGDTAYRFLGGDDPDWGRKAVEWLRAGVEPELPARPGW